MRDRRVILAQELHDGIAQDLVGLGFSIDATIAQSNELQTRQSLRMVRFAITELIEKVRREIHQLRQTSELVDETTPSDTSYELLRAFAEILRNVSEHSQASRLIVEVTDNGIGGAQGREGRFGLTGIQERVATLHGDFHIDSNENGTKIRIDIPLES